ncbi:MAG TPA: glucosidase [Polyangiaceae bacterium]|nr:glucosidase [Polyangiaceae bacterium]
MKFSVAPKVRSVEALRLREAGEYNSPWRRFGPYLSERQWGTVREDYSAGGNAWEYFPHDHARSRAYRWGEDGLAGFSDHRQRLCLGLALWNERDPILKERLFGLTNGEGNHGEDVKEQYFYLDATPTHSYLKMLYKYPQCEFPYGRLVDENRRRSAQQPELELVDLGVFDGGRYFDVFVEYAKASPNDILCQITVENRGPESARLRVLPQAWFRNTWSFEPELGKPSLAEAGSGKVKLQHPQLHEFFLHFDAPSELLFTENETNGRRLWNLDGGGPFKDAFHEYVVDGRSDAVATSRSGTKVAAHYRLELPPGGRQVVRLRLSQTDNPQPFADFDTVFAARLHEANEFYAELQAEISDADARLVQRQAFAGMIWSKQYFGYDVRRWLMGDPGQPSPPEGRKHARNADWDHLVNDEVISMPDKWEYPWYAAWDLAFHCIPLALIDAEFAKQQLVLLTREWYMHPNGQLPAYEWAFGDVNPPVHAWAAWRVYQLDRKQTGRGDVKFLERIFHKLMLNFTWWVNRKDAEGRNVFQGGFLGLDNIGVFDRSKPLPTGGFINQSDGTAWVAMYSLNLMRIALELAQHNDVYEDIASKFFEHFLHIAEAMTKIGGEEQGLWDDTDKFYYDVLCVPGQAPLPLRIRSMVGLIPLFAVEVLEPELLDNLPGFDARLRWFLEHRPDLAALVSRWQETATDERHLLSLLRGHRMKKLLRRMLDETEFLSSYGVRGLSRQHLEQPFELYVHGESFSVKYLPAESESGLFGGNSNWRGPIWMPVNYLLIESLQKFHHYYGDDFKVECPTGSGRFLTLAEIADELSRRLCRLFLRDEQGRRAVLGDSALLQDDPHFRDYVPFYEYFHGDNGRGVGASHQTGWTGLVAKLLMPRRSSDR